MVPCMRERTAGSGAGQDVKGQGGVNVVIGNSVVVAYPRRDLIVVGDERWQIDQDLDSLGRGAVRNDGLKRREGLHDYH